MPMTAPLITRVMDLSEREIPALLSRLASELRARQAPLKLVGRAIRAGARELARV